MNIFSDAFNTLSDIADINGNNYTRGLTEAGRKLYDTLDKTIQNSYIESGWIESNKKTPNVKNVITQSPELIITIKKKIFSSLQNGFQPDKMDLNERMFMAASKQLFSNKCQQIEIYERFTKAEHIAKTTGIINEGLAAFIINTADAADASLGDVFGANLNFNDLIANKLYSGYRNVIGRLRALLYQNGFNTTTKWIKANNYTTQGNGIIELTMVTNFNCTNSIKFAGGNASFTVLDPNRLFVIDEYDIEKALLQTSDSKYNVLNSYTYSLQKETDDLISIFNRARKSRNASPISVQMNPYASLYNRVIIIMDKYGIELTANDGSGLRPDLFNVSNAEAKTNFGNLVIQITSVPAGNGVQATSMFNVQLPNGGTTSRYQVTGGFTLADVEIIDNVHSLKDFGFSGTEKDLLKRIFDNSSTICQSRSSDFQDYVNYNENTNYARRMMRQFYLGRQLIQPMDIVTAFISSQTIEDNAVFAGLKTMFSATSGAGALGNIASSSVNKLGGVIGQSVSAVGGLINSSGVSAAGNAISDQSALAAAKIKTPTETIALQSLDIVNMPRFAIGSGDPLSQLNSNIGDLKELWGGIVGTNRPNLALEAERNLLAGPDFPMYLYLSLRKYFGATNYGTCVFNGVVATVGEQGTPGNTSLNVSCKDNTYYFDQVYYQDNPATYQFNGHLYDPFTPFDVEFDEATGRVQFDSNFKLLDENIELINSGVLKYKYGRFVNKQITQDNMFSTDYDEIQNQSDPYTTSSNYKFSDNAQNYSSYYDLARRVFYNPDGLAYRWKKGVGTAWVNQSRTGDGQAFAESLIKNESAVIIRKNPFAGQDIVNIISMLVTGEPYNFSSFVDSALRSGLLSNIYSNKPADFFDNLSKLIRKSNRMWGDFIPFKKFSVDPALFAYLMNSQLTLKVQSSKIKELQKRKAQLIDQLVKIDTDFVQSAKIASLSTIKYDASKSVEDQLRSNRIQIAVGNSLAAPIVNQILNLDAQINVSEAKIEDAVSTDSANKGLRIIGSEDVMSGFYEGSPDVTDTREAAGSASRRLARKQNYITQRRLWQVKSGLDKNLFIVCDEYDHDTDIQILSQALKESLDFINTSWQNIGSRMNTMANIIGMELFANSQGHIELRIPQYNRVPSSIFFDMIKKKRKYGLQLYPTFLEKTFTQRLTNIFEEIEIDEDYIRLYSSLLGANTDIERNDILNAGVYSTVQKNGVTGDKFIFVTDEDSGSLASIQAAIGQINNDYSTSYDNPPTGFLESFIPTATINDTRDFFERNADNDFNSKRYNYFSQVAGGVRAGNLQVSETVLGQLDPQTISKQVSNFKLVATETFNNFDIIKQRQNIEKFYWPGTAINEDIIADKTNNEGFERIIRRLQRKTGRNIDRKEFIAQNYKNSSSTYTSQTDIIAIQDQINAYVSKRYSAILSAMNIIKNLDQAARANASSDTNVLASLLMPNLFPGDEIPDYLSHMIEDETEDDYGYGAGKRYVIEPKHIKNISYQEQPPEFTSISIKGAQAGGLVGTAGFDVGQGMELNTVWAVDYDLWRMYGYKEATSRELPFLSNVETQIAPYAVYMMAKQRAGILHAGLTLVGNEYMQPGEVYYIKDRDLLFYAEEVKHSFSYGGDFSTTLSLSYGHTVGEYIPTPLDVIGKSIYRGHYTNVGSYRMSHPAGANVNPDSEVHMGTLIFDPALVKFETDANNVPLDTEFTVQLKSFVALFEGDIGERNKATFADMLYKLKYAITSSNSFAGDNKYAAVSVRIYGDKTGFDAVLFEAATQVIDALKNPSIISTDSRQEKGKNAEDSAPITSIPASKIIGGSIFQDIVGQPRQVLLPSPNDKASSVDNSTVEQLIRTPSAKAIEYAKEFSDTKSFISSVNDIFNPESQEVKGNKLRQALKSKIIDVWVEYLTPTTDLKNALESADLPTQETTRIEYLSSVDEFYTKLSENTGVTNGSSSGYTISISVEPK